MNTYQSIKTKVKYVLNATVRIMNANGDFEVHCHHSNGFGLQIRGEFRLTLPLVYGPFVGSILIEDISTPLPRILTVTDLGNVRPTPRQPLRRTLRIEFERQMTLTVSTVRQEHFLPLLAHSQNLAHATHTARERDQRGRNAIEVENIGRRLAQ